MRSLSRRHGHRVKQKLDRCFLAVTVLMAWIACIETVLTAFRGQAAAKKCLRMSQRARS